MCNIPVPTRCGYSRGGNALGIRRLPAFRADERDEYAAYPKRVREAIALPRHDVKRLLKRGADWNHEAAAVRGQLSPERVGNARRARGDEDRVEPCMHRAAQRAIAPQHERVRALQPREAVPRRV